VVKSTYRVWLEARFKELYGDTVRVYRGIRVKPKTKVDGLYVPKNGEGQMVIVGNRTAAADYGRSAPDLELAKRAESTEVVVIGFDIRVDHIARDANDPDLQHLFIKPDVDITKLPNYSESRYDIATFDPNKL
jgi:hypothetical protein